MTDRELLEAATKAAGYDVRWHENWQCFVHVGPFNTDNPPTLAGQRMVWLPLTDDGDALRLAVKLGMEIHIEPTFVRIWTRDGDCEDTEVGSDPYAATRRAIVRAAAAIGKDKP